MLDPLNQTLDQLAEEEVPMECSIEVARTADFLNVAALDRISWLQSGSDFIPDGEHVWRVWGEHATVLVCRTAESFPESHDIAGALIMFPTDAAQQFLHKIMVHPDCRGHGLGTQLMQAGLQRSTVPVLLTVNPENHAAVHVYEKLGFQVQELVKGYYRSHEHRYVMIYHGIPEETA
jgi:ribosomal protein S18 acetylase RimI-like enzyme